MISVGIDISKRKSTAAILNVQGEVICNHLNLDIPKVALKNY